MATSQNEFRALSPEQQETLAMVEPRRVQMRERLVNRARRYRGVNVVAGLLAGATVGLAIYSNVEPKALQFAVIGLVVLITFHAGGINRRLDALMKLLDEGIKRPGGGKGDKEPAA